LIAYCGLDCSKCEGYLATQADDAKKIAAVARKWSRQFHSDVKPEHVYCDGCKTGARKSFYCNNLCKIRACCSNKKFNTCVECVDFPCTDVSFVLDHAPEAKENLEKERRNNG